MTEVTTIRGVVDPAVELCARVIDAAVSANPGLSPNAIRMTICDVLTASVARVVARANPARMPVGKIIERHANHTLQMVLIADAVDGSEHNPERPN